MTVYELERQIKDIKTQEAQAALERECKQLKDAYEGKAFGSRVFERQSKATGDCAVYIKSIYLGTPPVSSTYGILADIWNIRVSRDQGDSSISRQHYNYSRSRNETCQLSSERYNAAHTLHGYLPHLYKEITAEKFSELWSAAEVLDGVIEAPFHKALGDYQDMLRIGTSNDDRNISNSIVSTGLDIIDMLKYPTVWNEIKYCQLTMFQNQRWIPRQFAKQVFQYQIGLWREELKKSWDHKTDEYTRKRIDILEGFIKQYL